MLTKPIPSPLFVGVAIQYELDENHHPRFGIYVHDGFWSWDFYEKGFPTSTIHLLHDNNGESIELDSEVIKYIKEYQREKQCKIIMAGLVNCQDTRLSDLARRLWFDLDIIPCILTAKGTSLDEKACSVARKTTQYIHPTGIPGLCKVHVGYRHEVEVDANGRSTFCSLEDYRRFFCDATWNELLRTAELVKQTGKRIVFFNSTPQGGGVAIIRHSTIRIYKLLGVDAHWFVMKPNPEVFEITKKKFHNVLQGVAPADTVLTEHEKTQYMRWCESNMNNYWSNPDCPVGKADVIVIDDPQPAGMIPFLKKVNPTARLVYRSHIELCTDLIEDPSTIQHQVWNFLWNHVQLCDVFVSHPVEKFIPHDVRQSPLVVRKFPAVTDPCDGLNKTLDQDSTAYYRLLFNRIAFDQIERKIDFDRPYFVQISRFDPSKGIPDLVDAYIRFRMLMEDGEDGEDGGNGQSKQNGQNGQNAQTKVAIPQLVITGHGSIDDPEGHIIHQEIINRMSELMHIKEEYVRDIIVVRLGPSDQMLNTVLSGARVAFQLSHREGFEVKVSEALLKGVPVVAYESGGIPLQIRDNVDGHLIPTGDVEKVAEMMKLLTIDEAHYERLKTRASEDNREWILTPSNVLHWNYIMLNGDININEVIPRKPQ